MSDSTTYAQRLRAFTRSLGRGSRRGPNHLLGIDIGPNAIYVAELLRRKQELTIERVLAIPVPKGAQNDRQRLGQLLRRELAAAGVTARHCVVAVPRRLAVVKPITLPPGSHEERQNMARFQAERVLPFRMADAHADYAPTSNGGEADVLMCAAKRQDVEHYTEVAEHAGLTVAGAKISPMPYALDVVRSCVGDSDGRTAVVYVTEEDAEIAMVQRGSLGENRGVPLPRAEDDTDPRWLGKLLSELRRSFLASSASEGVVERVMLCGRAARLVEVADAIAFELNTRVEIVGAGDGAELVRIVSKDEAATPAANTGAIRAAAAAAEAIQGTPEAVDVLHSRFNTAPPSAKAQQIKALAAAGLIAALLLTLPYVAVWGRGRRLKQIRAEIEELYPKSSDLAAKRKVLSFYAPWREKRPKWLEVLRELSLEEIMPYGMYIVWLEFKESQQRHTVDPSAATFEVELRGRTRDADLVYGTLIPRLKASRLFRNVTPKTMGPSMGSKGREFQVRANVRAAMTPPKSAEPKRR